MNKEDMNVNNELLKALTQGEIKADGPIRPPKKYEKWQVSNNQRRGVINGNK